MARFVCSLVFLFGLIMYGGCGKSSKRFFLSFVFPFATVPLILGSYVTPQNVTIAAKCNNINAEYNKVINAKCKNFPMQNAITFLTQNVISLELQVCST